MQDTSEPEIVYLDNAAATRCDPRVVEVIVGHHLHGYGNPGALTHASGRAAAQAVNDARVALRRLVASSLPDGDVDVVFTSGATEANNLLVTGLLATAPAARRRIVTSSVEHASIVEPLAAARDAGFDVVACPVDANGRVDLDALRELVDDTTLLVTIQLANNELGTIQPVDRIADIAHAAGAIVHCDSAQAVGKVPVDMGVLDIDAISLSGGKFHGPKGTGALVVRRAVASRLTPLQRGGGQEGGLRSGTTDVPGVAGLGEAARICVDGLAGEVHRIAHLRNQLEDLLAEALPGLRVNGGDATRVPGILSVVLPRASASLVLGLVDDVAASTGSACSAGGPSRVLRAIGHDDATAARTLRLSLGRFTTEDDVRRAARSLVEAVGRIERRAGTLPSRQQSSPWTPVTGAHSSPVGS